MELAPDCYAFKHKLSVEFHTQRICNNAWEVILRVVGLPSSTDPDDSYHQIISQSVMH